jgi:DNA-binding FrmR family transcriptional regulator
MTKDEKLQEIAEQLSAISDSLDGINEELADISMSSKMLIIFKLIELRPEMKEKLGPLINDLTELMDFDLGEG